MGVKLERTHSLLSLTQTDLGWSFSKIFDAKRILDAREELF